MLHLSLHGVSGGALALVLEHIYTSKVLPLDAQNIAEVLDFSVLYDFVDVSDYRSQSYCRIFCNVWLSVVCCFTDGLTD